MRTPSNAILPLTAVMLIALAVALPNWARAEDAKPAFDELVVNFEPGLLSSFAQAERLQILSTAQCWYRAEAREARAGVPARSGGVFDHVLSADRIRRLNRLLEATDWLSAPGAEGPATHTDAQTIKLTLRRQGKQVSVTCLGQRPEPYAALLHELESLAIQERRIYLHDYVSGQAGAEAWQEVAHELEALRGGPYAKSPWTIDYGRYLPIARRIVRGFYGEPDDELIPAVRLVAYFRADSELVFLHRMAHDRSPHLRSEVAWALGRIHAPESLPVLVSMMAAQGTRGDVGFELIRWGDAAVPNIVDLIGLSTDERLEPRENTQGEDMIRAYLDHWKDLDQPVDPRVVAAVRKALARKNPQNGLIRTTYHTEFLEKAAGEQ